MKTVQVLRHTDLAPELNPSGEVLLNRESTPYKFWIPDQKFIVLGNSQSPDIELNLNAVLADKIPIYKRMSGGGTVLLSPECICVGFRFAKQPDLQIHDYFKLGSGFIIEALKEIPLSVRGISDIVFQDRKIAGCALYMPRDFVLYLASILIHPNYEEMEKYLAHPSKEPDYRAKRKHKDFLIGLDEIKEKVGSQNPDGSENLIVRFEASLGSVEDKLDWAV